QFGEAFVLAQEAGDVRRQVAIYINNGVALLEADELGAAKSSLEKAATTANVHFRIRCYTNLAIMHYEAGDAALARKAAEAVLSMNSAYQSQSVGNISYAIIGLLALTDHDDDTANECYEAIAAQPWTPFDDVSYPAIFLGRMLEASGNSMEALSLFDRTIASTRARDTLCTFRIECERARLLASSNTDRAYAVARRIKDLAGQLGAVRVASRAQDILTLVRTLG